MPDSLNVIRITCRWSGVLLRKTGREARGHVASMAGITCYRGDSTEILPIDQLHHQEHPACGQFKGCVCGILCGICVAFCPTGALAKDESGNPYVKDIGKCIRCGWCEIRCPDFAITVQQKDKKKEGKGEEAESEDRGVAAGQ